MVLSDVKKRAQKAGKPPGSLVYTGNKTVTPKMTLISYDSEHYTEKSSEKFEDLLPLINPDQSCWIDVEGLSNVDLIAQISSHFDLHRLTVEDILNVEQRAKIDEFEKYLFVSLKMLSWDTKQRQFKIEQLSIILGQNFLLTFTETPTLLFETIFGKLRSGSVQRLRSQGTDYLFYRLVDTVIDQYFVVLEGLGEEIDALENLIMTEPTQQNSRSLYRLKRQTLMLRKAIWPMREVINHISQSNERFITDYTRLYMRDVYDHTVQAIDTIETYRDMLSSMLDVYLSSLTNRMNEVMKTLTIIATIFIPITYIASVYGMNFSNMPELQWHYGYYFTLGLMVMVAVSMLSYFKYRKWF
jgi:magnesium transporter